LMSADGPSSPRAAACGLSDLIERLETFVVGQRPLLERLVIALLTGGHVLIEGVPGLAKTRAVRALARALDLPFRRIQFTPDLLPETHLDRFLMKLTVGYPDRAAELAMLDLPSVADAPLSESQASDPPPLFGPRDVLVFRALAASIRVAPAIKEYVVDLVRAT